MGAFERLAEEAADELRGTGIGARAESEAMEKSAVEIWNFAKEKLAAANLYVDSRTKSLMPRAGESSFGACKTALMTMREVPDTIVMIDEAVRDCGIADFYERALGDQEILKSMASSAADYIITPKKNGGLQLTEKGVELTVSDGRLTMRGRRESTRGERAEERNEVMPLSHGGRERGVAERYADLAIVSGTDPRGGRIRRDGVEQSSRTKGNTDEFGRPRANVARVLSTWAQWLPARMDKPMPHLGRLRAAELALRAKVTEMCKDECDARMSRWMTEGKLSRGARAGLRVWGEALCAAEIARFESAAEATERVLDERGNLGVLALRAARGLGVETIEESLTGETKRKFAQMGLSDAGWKRLGQVPPEYLTEIMRRFSLPDPHARGRRGANSEREAELKALFQTANVAAERGLSGSVLEGLCAKLSEDEGEFRRAFVGLFDESLGKAEISSMEEAKAYLAESEAKQVRLPRVAFAFLRRCDEAGVDAAADELSLLNDFLSSGETGVWQNLPENPSWGALNRAQREWHEFVARKENGGALEWLALLPSKTDEAGVYAARELTSGMELLEEGKTMHHCVSSYARRCHEGSSRIFSIRRDDKRYGTLELSRNEVGEWRATQFKRACNAAVEHEDAWTFAKALAKEYDAKFRAKEAAKERENDGRQDAEPKEEKESREPARNRRIAG